MDMSFMAKFLVQGRDAGRVLEGVAANVDGEAGRITYTQWLNEDGRLEADLTVTKLEDERSGSSPRTPRIGTWRRG